MYCLYGNNIDNSLSPLIMNYFINKYNLKHKYILQINKNLNDIDFNKLNGANITTPFKYDIIKYCNFLDKNSEISKSVNCINVIDKKIYGYNFDGIGMIKTIENTINVNKQNKILVLGFGPCARSIVYSLCNYGYKNIYVSNRSINNIFKLKNCKFNVINFNYINKTIENEKFDIVINAKSINMYNLGININKNTYFFDCIYKDTIINSSNYINGKLMLLFQATYAFKVWFNIEPVIDNNLKKLILNA